MDIDWFKLIQSIFILLNFLAVIGVFVFQRVSHEKITTNDLRHIDLDLKAILKKQEEFSKNQMMLQEDVSYLKGKMESETNVLEILTKVLEK